MKKSITMLVAVGCMLLAPSLVSAEASDSAHGATTAQQQQTGVKKIHHRFSAEQIEAIQKALNDHGATLTVTGKWNRETREAIREFQKGNKLKPTGRANKKTRKELGLNF